jgi:hypothetical protein
MLVSSSIHAQFTFCLLYEAAGWLSPPPGLGSGPNPTALGRRGWTMSELAARFRLATETDERGRAGCACRSEDSIRFCGVSCFATPRVRDGAPIPLPPFRNIFDERRPA